MPKHILLPPSVLRYGESETTVGATVFRALAALLRADGSLTSQRLCQIVWKKDCTPAHIKALVHRCNVKLAAVHSPRRCEVDGPRVRLC